MFARRPAPVLRAVPMELFLLSMPMFMPIILPLYISCRTLENDLPEVQDALSVAYYSNFIIVMRRKTRVINIGG